MREPFSAQDTRRLQGIEAELGRLELGAEGLLERVAGELRTLLSSEVAILYRPVVGDLGVSLDFCHIVGAGDAASRFTSYFANAPRDFGAYDVIHPQANQRNRVVDTPWLGRHVAPRSTLSLWNEFVVPAGLGACEQLRVLLCDEGTLVAWTGVLREKPFGPREHRLLRALVPKLRERLRLDIQLGAATLYEKVFVATLEALPTAAFLVDAQGSIRHANGAGARLVDGATIAALRARLREAIAGRGGGFEVTEIAGRGMPRMYLAQATDAWADRLAKVERARQTWNLTRRQVDVLEALGRGLPTKFIAHEIGCSLRTVEAHVTGLFRRTGAASRLELFLRLNELG